MTNEKCPITIQKNNLEEEVIKEKPTQQEIIETLVAAIDEVNTKYPDLACYINSYFHPNNSPLRKWGKNNLFSIWTLKLYDSYKMLFKELEHEIFASAKVHVRFDIAEPCMKILYKNFIEYLRTVPKMPQHVSYYFSFCQKSKTTISKEWLDFTDSFHLIEKNLFYITNPDKNGYNFISRATDHLINQQFFEHKPPKSSFYKKFFTYFKKYIDSVDMIEDLKFMKYCHTNFSIVTLQNNIFSYIYLDESQNFFCKLLDSKNYIFPSVYLDINLFSQQKTHHPKSSLEFLYELTNHDMNTLDKVSELFANIMTNYHSNNHREEDIKQSLHLIIGDNDLLTVFRDILNKLFPNVADCLTTINIAPARIPLVPMNKLSNPEIIQRILLANIRQKLYIPCYLQKACSDRQISTIKRLINGKKINSSYNTYINYELRNRMPLLCFASKQQDINTLRTTFHCQSYFLDFDKLHVKKLLSLLSDRDISWIAFTLSIHGLMKLKEGKIPRTKKNSHVASIESIIKEFIASCCIKSGNCYAKDLYSAYVEYHRSLYKHQPLTPIIFNKYIKRSGLYEYKKLRSSRKSSSYSFVGISIDPDKKITTLSDRDLVPKDIQKEEYYQYLIDSFNAISSQISNLFMID